MGLARTSRKLNWQKALVLMGCSAVLVCGARSSLHAQLVQLRPVADISLPTRISIQNGLLHVRQKVGLSLGARMTVTFSNRFDLITAVTYSPGYASLHGGGKRFELSSGTHSLGSSTGVRYWLLPPPARLSWEIHTGAGLVFGGQPSYEDLFESSTVSAVLGSTLIYQIGRIVSLKLRINERLYRIHFGSGDPVSSKRPLQLSFGLGLPFLESAR
jgi:hypothetical protein